MFDTILNDLDEDTTSLHVGSEINSDKSIDSEEDDDLVELDDASDSDDADDLKDDESLVELVESESWSDDPVRMYLTQMGEIPLLTRQEEISLAKEIEVTRRRFPPQAAGMRLRHSAGRQGSAPGPHGRIAVRSHGPGLGDRPAGKGPDPRPSAAQFADVWRPCFKRNDRITTRHQQVTEDVRAPRGLAAARSAPPSGGQLVEELGLRTAAHRADDQDRWKISAAASTSFKAKLDARMKNRAAADFRAEAAGHRVPQHPAGHAGNAHQPAQPRPLSASRFTPSINRPSAACRKATCGWWFRSPRSIATAA